MDLTEGSKPDQFVAAIYWATTTIATVGYGDISPTTTAERIVAMIIMLLGELGDTACGVLLTAQDASATAMVMAKRIATMSITMMLMGGEPAVQDLKIFALPPSLGFPPSDLCFF